MMTRLFVRMGARITFPIRSSYIWIDYLKIGSSYRDVNIIYYVDYGDPEIVDRLIADNNVVINLIAGQWFLRKYKYYHTGNVEKWQNE